MDKPTFPLISGLIAAIAAGLCCTAPLVLISMGLGGAWISQLAELAPLRPLFIVLAILSFVWAGWKLYRPVKYCRPAAVCSEPRAHRRRSDHQPLVDLPVTVWSLIMELQSRITCPHCGHQRVEQMPIDACLWFYHCEHCRALLTPRPGDCCVFCSWGSVPCPPVQQHGRCCE